MNACAKNHKNKTLTTSLNMFICSNINLFDVNFLVVISHHYSYLAKCEICDFFDISMFFHRRTNSSSQMLNIYDYLVKHDPSSSSTNMSQFLSGFYVIYSRSHVCKARIIVY